MNGTGNRIRNGRMFTRRQTILGAAAAFGGIVIGTVVNAAPGGGSPADDEISHAAESIHQETLFKASRKRVYEALTDTAQFNKVTQFSAAVKSGMALGSDATRISRDAGGEFALFGGYISGRHIELIPNERIVQAWRVGSWEPGVYSIARFALLEQGSDTKLIFDHTGFPVGQAEHLAGGWKSNYWEPLTTFLAS